MALSTHRKASSLSAAVVAMTLAIGSVSFAPAARAGDAESDAMWELYRLHAQGCARQPESLGCVGFFGRAFAARPAIPTPSPAAVPARLRRR